MRFYGISRHGMVITDDYSDTEISNGLHIKNIVDDFKDMLKYGYEIVKIYNENNVFIKKIKVEF